MLMPGEKKWFKPEAIPKITFSGEPAVDGGGPRREFFTGECSLIICNLYHGWKKYWTTEPLVPEKF